MALAELGQRIGEKVEQFVPKRFKRSAAPTNPVSDETHIAEEADSFNYLWNLPKDEIGELFHGRDYSIQIYKFPESGEPSFVMVDIYSGQSDPGSNDIPQEGYIIEKDGVKTITVQTHPSTDPAIVAANSSEQRSVLEQGLGATTASRLASFVQEQLFTPRPPSEKGNSSHF